MTKLPYEPDAYIIGYLAGIIDGESCIRITKGKGKGKNHKYGVTLAIQMNDPQAIEVFVKYFGGNINIKKGKKRKIKGIDNSHSTYAISYSINKTYSILKLCLNSIYVKREQAELALEFIEYKKNLKRPKKKNNLFSPLPAAVYTKYENYRLKMRALKQKYWIKNDKELEVLKNGGLIYNCEKTGEKLVYRDPAK